MKSLIRKVLFLNISILIVTFVFIAGCQQQKPDPSQELKPIADKLVEAWNGGNLDSLDAIIDPSFVRTVNQMPDVKGVDGFKKVISGLRTTYPDLKLSIDNEIYSENSLAYRWVLAGTNTGPGEMPPTGKSYNNWGLTIIYFANGKITRQIVAYDEKSFFEQLGFTITPPSETKK